MRLLNIMEGAVGHYESISRGPEYTGARKGHGGFQRDLRRAEELAVVSEWGGEASTRAFLGLDLASVRLCTSE